MDVSLRPVTPGDAEFLFAVYAGTRREEVGGWGWDAAQELAFLRMQWSAQQRSYEAAYSGAEHAVILADGQPVGRIVVYRAGDHIRLVDIAVLPIHRGRGIGTALIQELMIESQQTGRPLRLAVLRGNQAAGLYERLGFQDAGVDHMYRQMEWSPLR